jgi:hypothetical protein
MILLIVLSVILIALSIQSLIKAIQIFRAEKVASIAAEAQKQIDICPGAAVNLVE